MTQLCDSLKYVLIGILVIVCISMLLTYLKPKNREGLGNDGPYTATVSKLDNSVSTLNNMMNIDSNRRDIEDILTNLKKMMQLAQIKILLGFANGAMDPAATKSTSDSLKSLKNMEESITESIPYLDRLSNVKSKISSFF